jgi:hypothetical protein
MDEMYENARLQAAQAKKSRKPLKKVSPRTGSDDGKEEVNPLARLKKDKEKKPEPTDRAKSRASSGRGGTASHSASRLARASPRSEAGSQAGGLTSRTAVSTFSLKSHPPPRDRPVARLKWEINKRCAGPSPAAPVVTVRAQGARAEARAHACGQDRACHPEGPEEAQAGHNCGEKGTPRLEAGAQELLCGGC